jgi:hypothetical protein
MKIVKPVFKIGQFVIPKKSYFKIVKIIDYEFLDNTFFYYTDNGTTYPQDEIFTKAPFGLDSILNMSEKRKKEIEDYLNNNIK